MDKAGLEAAARAVHDAGTRDWNPHRLATHAITAYLAALPSPEPVADQCADCHTLDPVWSAPNELWNRVVGGTDAKDDPGIRLCPTCFIRRAEAAGIAPVWHLAASSSPDPVAWQWSYLGDWFTMPMDKVEDAERYARSMAASTGGAARAIYAAPPSQREVIEALIEASNQIEYLHGKFQETGSGNAVIAKLADVRRKMQGAAP